MNKKEEMQFLKCRNKFLELQLENMLKERKKLQKQCQPIPVLPCIVAEKRNGVFHCNNGVEPVECPYYVRFRPHVGEHICALMQPK